MEMESKNVTNSNNKEESSKSSSELSKIEQRDEARLCKICFNQELGIILLPCGHMVLCGPCSIRFNNCPYCRSKINAKLQAFLP